MSQNRCTYAGIAAFFTAYFAWFSWGFLRLRFSPDEVMNMYAYWHPALRQFLLSHLMIWQGAYRPMGGAFYLPLFYIFGWNPLPYHVVHSLVLLATVPLFFALARQLGCDLRVSAVVALIACYHDGLNQLYNNTAFVYDGLCGFFYFAAFAWYTRARSRGTLRWPETTAFLFLYLCALNSKEMAVTLPALLLVYEYLYFDSPSWRGVILSGLLNVPYIYGRVLAPGALATQTMYRPVFSWDRVLDFQRNSLSDLLLAWDHMNIWVILAVWALVTWLAWRRPRPILRFCWFWILLTPLPIEFLDGRSQATLYIPLFGWAVFASVILIDAVDAIAAWLPAQRRAAAAALLCAVLVVWAVANRRLQRYLPTALAQMGEQTWAVMQQMETLHPRVEPHSRVVFLNDPFEDWDMAFIADLWFRDRTVNVRLNRKTPLSPAELAGANHVFEFENGRLVQLR